jgi:hypothetical protein
VYLSCTALRSPFAHRGGVPRPSWEETGRPRPAHVAYRAGRQRGARAMGQEGEGACPFPLCTPPFACKGGRALTWRREEGAGRGALLPLFPCVWVRRHIIYVLFDFIFIYNCILLCFIIIHQNTKKRGLNLSKQKTARPDRTVRSLQKVKDCCLSEPVSYYNP